MAFYNKTNKVGIEDSPIYFGTPISDSKKASHGGRKWGTVKNPLRIRTTEVQKAIKKSGAQKLKAANELHSKFRAARDNAGQRIHKRATHGFHAAEGLTHINEEDPIPKKIGKVLVGSALSSPIMAAKLIYYIPAGTAYTLAHPGNAWKSVSEKAPVIFREMKDPKFSGRIAGGLAGAGIAQIAYGDVPVACTLFLSSGCLTLGSLTNSSVRRSRAYAKNRSTPTHLQTEKSRLSEKINRYDPARVFIGFKEGVLPGAMGAVFAHSTLGAVLHADHSVVPTDTHYSNLDYPSVPELPEAEFENKKSKKI